jgi:hypothetical protein
MWGLLDPVAIARSWWFPILKGKKNPCKKHCVTSHLSRSA